MLRFSPKFADQSWTTSSFMDQNPMSLSLSFHTRSSSISHMIENRRTVKRVVKMFQSQLMKSLQDLYLIHVIFEFQRSCNRAYTKLKHNILHLLQSRLAHLKLLGADKIRSSKRHYQDHQTSNERGSSNRFMRDLNRLVVNHQTQDSISIPIQMLLLPFFIQTPSSFIPQEAHGDSETPSYSVLSDHDETKASAKRQYVTLVPSNSSLVPIRQSHADFIIQAGGSHNFRSQYDRGAINYAHEASLGRNSQMTMRNPLIPQQYSTLSRSRY